MCAEFRQNGRVIVYKRTRNDRLSENLGCVFLIDMADYIPNKITRAHNIGKYLSKNII